MKRYRIGICFSVMVAALVTSSASNAQEHAARNYDVAAQDLKYSLRDVARQSGLELVATSDVLRGKQAAALKGHFTPDEALAQLLRGTGLTAEISGNTVYIRGRAQPQAAATDGPVDKSADIVVTGTRIRGAAPASPTITQTQDQIRKSGLTNLGDFARSLPQSFAGGQNPGVTVGVTGETNENVSSASSLNLRGLGPDATLTLLNGHRLAYNSAQQAIDISAIPLAAVDRIEIITDGASAIYGSDAVAGVANVILKRSFDGVSATARGGASTDGGDRQQEYSVVAGTTGAHAGFIVSYDFERDTPILAGQRSYTNATFPTTTLLPAQRHHSAILNGYWDVDSALTASVDAVYSSRHSTTVQPLASDDYADLGYRRTPAVQSYAISPKIEWALPRNWTATLLGTYAEDKTDLNSRFFSGGALSFASIGSYRNRSTLVELNFEGSLMTLPGGDVRVALGGGYRSNGLDANLATERAGGTTPTVQFSKNRKSYYGFGEVNLPIVSSGQEIPFVDHLSVSGAARYESYPGMASVATPKLGVVYAPLRGVEFKFSWGRSFKTPTLYQQFVGYDAELVPASYFGSTSYPASATALFLVGGNPDLKPERASTWTASIVLRPASVPHLKVEGSVFHVRYRDRITQPISSYEGLLTNPAYAALVDLNPALGDVGTAVGGSKSGIENLTGLPYDPGDVVAIIDSRYLNIARQTVSGIDIAADYRLEFAPQDTVTLSGSASYIHSKQELTPDTAAIPAAGVIFNPPHWRARGGAVWDREAFTVSAYGNYIGGVTDNRSTPEQAVRPMTTLDLTAVYRTGDSAKALGHIEFTLSVLNLLNDKPDRIKTSAPYYPAYDSTNYSVVGRFVSLSITKHL
ncbi:hypothetical protein GCM10009087_19260 [Sphingomonas oligophenolica]